MQVRRRAYVEYSAACGQPTVVAETSTGSVQVHCGIWRWQCNIPATGILPTALDAASGQELEHEPPGPPALLMAAGRLPR
ncbi:MAG: hypothetical protein LC808_43215 [Actinobacteria bacterium]|nr:hypothetical protein [Actinomycetota bacterium]